MKLFLRSVLLLSIFFIVAGCAPQPVLPSAPAPQSAPVEAVPIQIPKPSEPAPEPVPATPKVEPLVQQEILEKGGTLQEWKSILQQQTGSESEESRTAAECEALMKDKIAECSKHPGWSVDNAMEITDFKTGKHYEFQDIKRQDCPGTDKPPYTVHTETAFLDARTESSSSYQVVCSIGCNWWDCDADLSGVWQGSYSETSSDAYCKYSETGTKTFRITMKDSTFSGDAEYSGTSTATGDNCQGGSYTNKGTLSGKVSGSQVSGTIVYSTTSLPFKATLENDVLSGTYSYTTTAYGSPLSGNGEFTLKRK